MGFLALMLGVALLVPLGIAAFTRGPDLPAFLLSAGISSGVGGLLILVGGQEELGAREACAVATGTWLLYAALGGLPYLLSGALPTFTDAFFETMSGFTTTGTSVVADVEKLPVGILFWRNFTQWIGGMGMIVLSVALLPFFGVGGLRLVDAEASGISVDRLVPRIGETAKRLWGAYVVITLAEILLLSLGGMPVFDSILHTFATLATGGFSNKNASIGAYPSAYLQWVIIVFMFLSGTNFTLHYFGLQGKISAYWKSDEFRLYLAVSIGATLFAAAFLGWAGGTGGVERTLRDAAFQVLSIITTTGFATADYELWPVVIQGLLLFLMLIGACAGSTGGGIKYVRLCLMIRQAKAQLLRLVHRRAVQEVRLDGRPALEEVRHGAGTFFLLYLALWVAGSLALVGLGMDLISALSAVAANMGNVGPGLGAVGPTDNYFAQPAATKWILSVLMAAGRLEIYPMLVLFHRAAWRK